MNRYQLEQMLAGVGQELKAANDKLMAMYTDPKTTLEARNEQKEAVKDLEERYNGIKTQIEEMDRKAQAKLNLGGDNPEDAKVKAKAELIRSVMAGKPVPMEVKSALGDDSTTGGGKILPKTMTNELLHEPFAKNPLRNLSTFTSITNLEVPKINFSLDDDDFIEDTKTAKELELTTDTVVFGRNKFKVFASVSETVLRGTDTNLVETVENALESGLAAKEKKVAFATSPKLGEEHMSFYAEDEEGESLIEVIEDDDLYKAIKGALADLEDNYSENASIVMKKSDYYDIIEKLANGSTTLYMAQPEQVLGAPVEFCDLAVYPVVGDFRYSHFNYDIEMLYDRDKNVRTGMEDFVLTAWIDHQIKLKSAFRIAKKKVTQG